MDALIILLAIIGGAVFGLIIGYILNSQYFNELYFIFDDDRKDNLKRFKAREARLLKELARRDIKIAKLEELTREDRSETEESSFTVTALGEISDPYYSEYQDLDFKGDF
jgi:hypothetical protein